MRTGAVTSRMRLFPCWQRLESLQLGPDFCEKITSDAIRVVALCCPRLKRLRLSGLRDVDGVAIGALVDHCRDLSELGFFDCMNVDETALGNATTLRFFFVCGRLSEHQVDRGFAALGESAEIVCVGCVAHGYNPGCGFLGCFFRRA